MRIEMMNSAQGLLRIFIRHNGSGEITLQNTIDQKAYWGNAMWPLPMKGDRSPGSPKGRK